jgi:hypothetical protein
VDKPPAAGWQAPAAPPRKRERRRRAGLQPLVAAGAAPVTGALAKPRRDPVRVAWGLLWRYATVGAVAFAVVAGLHLPDVSLVVVGAGGLLLGLWFRRGWVPALWRAAVLGWLAAATAGSWFFPVVLVAALLVVSIEPWLAARRPPRSRDHGSGGG